MRVPSLRVGIALAVFALIMGLGLAGTVHARFTVESVAEESLIARGRGIANDLENESRTLLLMDDNSSLNQRTNSIMQSNDDALYIVVLDSNGMVASSTFATSLEVGAPIIVPESLLDAGSVLPGGATTIEVGGEEILDIARPISDGEGGIVRVGLSRELIDREVEEITGTLMLYTGGVLLAGIIVAYGLAYFLTRPLRQLADMAGAVGRGNLEQRVNIRTKDEVGTLATAFNSMADRLSDKERDRQRLLQRVISAQEEERKRVARELHDEAGQALTSLLIGLQHLTATATEPDARERAEDLHSIASETLEQMRGLAFDLRPSALDDLGLVPALQRYVDEYGEKTGIKTDFFASGLSERRISSEQEIAIYRIAQEALTNSARHAEADQVSVTMEERQGTLVVIAEDDGLGFDWEGTDATFGNRSLGLVGMEERAAIIGAHLTIESQVGCGTAIFLQVPL